MIDYEEFRKRLSNIFERLRNAITERQDIRQQSYISKEVISVCVPAAANLFTDKSWFKFWNKYNQRVLDLLNQKEDVNRSFYFIDYVFAFANDNLTEDEGKHIYKLFSAFNNTIDKSLELINQNQDLANKFKRKIEGKIIETITDGPKAADETENSAFKNHLNEIAFFYQIASHPKIGIVEIEKVMPNGKKADFHLVCDDTEYFVDTITIHNTEEREDINWFVEGKIEEKIKDKKINELQDEYIKSRFRVLPIIEFENRLIDFTPNLPTDKCFQPMISLLEEQNGEAYISLFHLPLNGDIKEQLKDNNSL